MTGYGPGTNFPWTGTGNYLRTDGPEPQVAPIDLSQVEVRWTQDMMNEPAGGARS